MLYTQSHTELHSRRLHASVPRNGQGQLKPFEIYESTKGLHHSLKETCNQIFSNQMISSTTDEQEFLLNIPSDKLINHDVELKKFIASKRALKQKTLNEKILLSNSAKVPATPRATKHKKQKSRSQIYPHKLSHKIQCQSTNRYKDLDENAGVLKQNQCPEPSLTRKPPRSKRNTIKFFEPARQSVKPVSLKSLEMQLVVKKTNQKRQSMINQIIKKLHLPQLNPRISNSLRMLVNSYHEEKELVACQKKSMKTIEVKRKKPSERKSLETTIYSKTQQTSKTFDIRKPQKEVFLSKIKFTEMKDLEGKVKLGPFGPEPQKVQFYRLFA